MRAVIWLVAVGAIGVAAGCSPDVASTAVTAGKLGAAQAEQAKAQDARFKQELGAALQAAEKAASAAAEKQ